MPATNRLLSVLVVAAFVMTVVGSAWALGLDDAIKIGKKVADETKKDKEKNAEDSPEPAKPAEAKAAGGREKPAEAKAGQPAEAQVKVAEVTADRGAIVFSKAPIDPKDPKNLTTEFKAGDRIYGLVLLPESWRATYKARDDATKVDAMIFMDADGEQTKAYQYLTLKKPELIDAKYLVLDVAPDVDKMVAYKDDASVSYGKGAKNRRIGPDAFTYELSQLKPGKHTIRVRFTYFGKDKARGDFTIAGDDYSDYATLREGILKVIAGGATVPPPGLTSATLEKQMYKLCLDAGMDGIVGLNIKDKDWWLDRKSGGDSPVVSRHIAAAVVTKAGDKYAYRICTFYQDRTITGWAPLELRHKADPIAVPAANVGKLQFTAPEN